MRKKSLWLILLLAILLILSFAILPAGGAQVGNRAGLVIVSSMGTTPEMHCINFTEDTISGLDLLQRYDPNVGIMWDAQGAAVCKIGNQGCPADETCLACQSPYFWHYWHWKNGQWNFSDAGAVQSVIKNGDIDGWVWSNSNSAPPAISIDQICAAGNSPTPTLTRSLANNPASPTTTRTPTSTSTSQPGVTATTALPTSTLHPSTSTATATVDSAYPTPLSQASLPTVPIPISAPPTLRPTTAAAIVQAAPTTLPNPLTDQATGTIPPELNGTLIPTQDLSASPPISGTSIESTLAATPEDAPPTRTLIPAPTQDTNAQSTSLAAQLALTPVPTLEILPETDPTPQSHLINYVVFGIILTALGVGFGVTQLLHHR